MSLYAQRGVSAQKEEVHAAIGNLDQGLYAKSFCKMYPDFLGGDVDWVNIMHADGAGTKSILAYLYWKETGDVNVWKGIAQDAIVMNLDDLLCVGAYDNIIFNSTIDRNKKLIPGEVLKAIIDGSSEVFEMLKKHGVNIHYLGGETADVGDVTRTIAVNGTMTVRWPKDKLISNEKIEAGNLIVGLASDGQANYETAYNSGLGSNGLTSARHDVLEKYYAKKYPESFEPTLADEVVYIGKYRLEGRLADGGWQMAEKKLKVNSELSMSSDALTTDDLRFTIPPTANRQPSTIGSLLLSPTRTYAPVLKQLLEQYFDKINGLIHCSGGGQTKCLKYVPDNVKIVKDNLFEPPIIFDIIKDCSGSNNREMYQVFNMGCRMEIYCQPEDAEVMIETAKSFGVNAQVIGRVEAAPTQSLEIVLDGETVVY